MKLAIFLSQFLYQHKRLALHGIGSFLLNDSFEFNTESPKQTTQKLVEISFDYNPAIPEDSELITFISSQTGKMKVLAASDLNSYLDLAIQFLNIGKPFKIEGIGTLVKNQKGAYSFTAEHIFSDKVSESALKKPDAAFSYEESFSGYDNGQTNKESTSFNLKKILFIFLFLIAIGLAIWGGYYLYKNSTEKNSVTGQNNPVQAEKSKTTDSVVQKTNEISIKTSEYKFILERSAKQRAFYRYAMLKSYNWDIRMETKDSVLFTLYLVIPANAQDTVRIRDSLTILSGQNVKIEN